MYHDIVSQGAEDSSGFPGRDAALYKVAPERFEAHLRAIVGAASPCPTLTFDDGGESATAAATLLERHGLRGRFFVTTDYIGLPGFVTEDAIVDLDQRGHTIGSHSCSHPFRMGHCGWAQLVDEWTESRDRLSAILGRPPSCASIPGGDYAPIVARAAAGAGYMELFTSEPTTHVRDVLGLTLLGRFTVRRWTSGRGVAALAAGSQIAQARQALEWNLKKIGKRIAGEQYVRLRRALLTSADGVGPDRTYRGREE